MNYRHFSTKLTKTLFKHYSQVTELTMKALDTKDEFNTFINSDAGKLFVIDFWAEWCGPCRIIGPKFEEMSKEFSDASFAKVNVDDADEISEDHGVSALPTFLLFKNGKKIAEVIGASEEKLRETIKSNM
ncbi:unnamed protein product [Owenia fusiformis]|uniref:Thioredoxin domain-containing protein n=1 Tax=Owenia fusiformis TaxID=6347 RepID=A0A8S4NFN9_OWEFU|nr:unnamed protein product [Owenia fusiformis]